MLTFDQVEETAALIRARAPAPDVGVILGSGLGAFADTLTNAAAFSYSELPHFPTSSVVGHAGRLVVGRVGGITAAVMAGRVHGYEGYGAAQVAFPARVLCRLGVRALLVTNAAGGIHPRFSAGTLMRITDHLNLSAQNPLSGSNDDRLGPRFPDLSHAYDPRLGTVLEKAAETIGLSIDRGIYAHLSGPSYETPAEIRMLRTLGADAVGMSTIPEVIVAAHMGVPVVGLSLITNLAAGVGASLSHQEVLETAERVRPDLLRLLTNFLPRLVQA